MVFIQFLRLGGGQSTLREAENDEIPKPAWCLDPNPVPDPYGPMGGCTDVVYGHLPAGAGLLGESAGLEHARGQQPAVDSYAIAVLGHLPIPHMKVLDRQRPTR